MTGEGMRRNLRIALAIFLCSSLCHSNDLIMNFPTHIRVIIIIIIIITCLLAHALEMAPCSICFERFHLLTSGNLSFITDPSISFGTTSMVMLLTIPRVVHRTRLVYHAESRAIL
ncbi:uncharacterized protein EI90DRAFT_3067832 [Cantharellus anzutake]|uniref:uncharacterized protein n=1 Tax=Cantharellus anzutake TaxID=1750568 RepID=UPI0019037AD9|nr:uncharacterized protein EI90DRAFT_3067832 [Cantharellus anzutake]KAF8327450.1 hypothetical protein EI90DRAFT_3067832 [Cantharellus anzutake]